MIFTCSKLLKYHSWLKHNRFLACESGNSACETGYGVLYIGEIPQEEDSLHTSSISSGPLIEKIISGLVERPFIEFLSGHHKIPHQSPNPTNHVTTLSNQRTPHGWSTDFRTVTSTRARPHIDQLPPPYFADSERKITYVATVGTTA